MPKPHSLLLLCAMSLFVLGPAEAKRRKSDPGPHPIKVLKIVQDGASRQGMNGCDGRYSIWVQNTTDVAVDKVKIEMELYSRSGRIVETVSKEIGDVEAGHKKISELKYNIVGEQSVKPRFWIMYNSGKEALTQFEADSNWNF